MADHGTGDAVSDHDITEDYDEAEHRPLDADDFDAFFAEEAPQRPKRQQFTLYGKRYTLPESLPLMYTLQAERLRESESTDDVRKMLAPLFGADALDEWAEHGMDDRKFRIIMLYAGRNIQRPGSLSMAEAARLYDEQEAARAEGKAQAPNRAARRAKPKGKKRASSGKR